MSDVDGGGEGGPTVFELVGGRPFFDRIVDRFYDGVASDALLRPLYPGDLTGSRRHLAGFLSQYWGGGTAHYSDARGHPRLRMRHGRFAIGAAERSAWLGHMAEAVRAEDLPADLETRILEYFAMAADHLVNVAG